MRRRLHGIDPWRFAAADDPEWHPDDTCLWCLEQGWATLDSASFENGILTVVIPKSERARRRRIDIQSDGGRQNIEAS